MRPADATRGKRGPLPGVAARSLPPALLLAVLLLAPGQAESYKRSVSDLGAEFYWKEESVGYVLDAAGSADIADDREFLALRAAFATWSEVECADGPLCLQFVDRGLVRDKHAGFDPAGPNENLVIFIDDAEQWRARDYSSAAIAMTSVTHDRSTGRIYDADIEFNDAGFRLVTFNVPVAHDNWTQDLQNAATHEIGHIVGLDHSADSRATMYGQALPGELQKRTLEEDDIAGACSIKPPCRPGGDDGSGGCSMSTRSPGAGSGSLGLGLLLLAGAAAILLPRAQRSRNPP